MDSRRASIEGTCDQCFEAVREVFDRHLSSGLDVGASVAVTIDGEYVVDLWGGHRDATRTKPWQPDTLVNVFSTTKVMAALCALVLVERGRLDLDAPVARYWPEFAQAGKEGILVRWLLAHSAGLSGFQEPLPADSLVDHARLAGVLARQRPWWEPGTRAGYHLVTFGVLLGEIVRRVSGRSLGAFFREEIAAPLDVDFHIGLAPEHDSRVADLLPPEHVAREGAAADRETIAARTLSNPPMSAAMAGTTAWRRAEIPASNGHGHARSAAGVGAVLAGSGQVRGARLLSNSVVDLAFEEQSFDTDLVLGVPVRWGLGMALAGPHRRFLNPRTAYWGGTGGSLLVMDRDARACFAYAMNRMRTEPAVVDPRGLALREALFDAMRAATR